MEQFKYPNQHPDLSELHFDEKNKTQVFEAIQKGESPVQKKKPKQKLALTGLAAAAIFLLFIGSAYFSPTMAKVAAKIPYFSLFIQQEEYKNALQDVVFEAMKDEKYNDLRNIEVSIPKREITIWFGGTKTEVKEIEESVIPLVNTAVKENNFGTYKIEVIHDKTVYDPIPEDSPEVEKYIKASSELEKSIIAQLEKHNYDMPFPVQARINEIEKYIYVAIPKTETRIAELEDLLRTVAKPYGDDFKLDIRKIDMAAREQEKRWEEAGIIHILVGGLMENEEFKVTGFSYSFHPLPLQIKVKTSVKSTHASAKELAVKIEQEIHTFIQTDDLTKDVRNDPYELIILGKDKKQMN
ncbi:DUF4030 domain-containing protein [Mesobacillus maritimus]|uniref:DUF4030 domain-containing protein n=1 Tax=Mesobacillus maritimus TaxID=1643336 RepID=A0ABS7KAN6_9BACI|nr:DUF4030 domain-containing protein [Mesobacillus maritimus]MBY0099136.1 DUF4030 domain-containing protein [Mesobacillus maritimus]